LGLLEKYQLTLEQPTLYGRWSAREEGLSFQDMLVVKKS
jgi:hypothetical protein